MQFPSIDPEQFVQFAHYVAGLKLYPYLDAAHYAMMCIIVRDDAQKTADSGKPLSRRHPLASWVASMLMCFAGSILSNALVGQMILLPFKSHEDLMLASAVWYMINYSPFDMVYLVATYFPGRHALTVAQQLYTVNKIDRGVSYVLRNHSGSYTIAALIGVMKGAGHCYMRLFARLICGIWTPSLHEILVPSFATKASLAGSVAFILESLRYIEAPHVVVYCGVLIISAYFSLISSFGLGIRDPFVPLETIICAVFFGGLVDLLARPFQRSQSTSGESMSDTHSSERLYDEPPEGNRATAAGAAAAGVGRRHAKKEQ